ncbi:plasmid pRiA4b ORF-3 family protein [Virgibacillus sp. 179-BFC.A HS]|uniref:Plasmid pRiA4b ORF-3 family protein n=1 Tax=Tigheibacillus jepli TaxID=3035914 RepID=A0ABU5CFE3_9BACI|nr:plasmid pRiA4b ORF-3 family protein [Virgibacillus sp. 179-BFC.A HS]MDY0405047.1 plasmid pRiA4b ORF-3 family protein [Virgibacillus sp. 179-BFC.A HS]
MIYELRITLRNTDKPVWRKIEIDSNATFYELHEIIQTAFDWDGFRMHRFEIAKSFGKRSKGIYIKPILSVSYNEPPLESSEYDLDERLIKISDWLGKTKDRAFYAYNIENENTWYHEIYVEKMSKPEKGVLYPYCTGARNIVANNDLDADLDESPKQLVKVINDTLQSRLSHLISEVKDEGNHTWEQLFKRSKDFYRMKPWDMLPSDNIFAVVEPASEELFFCSVLGAEGITYGLAVYPDRQEFKAFMKKFQGVESEMNETANQQILLLTYENREALSEQDHILIKSNDIPFRGKKAWPQFRSYRPGHYPQRLNEEEAKTMLVVLEQAIYFCENPELIEEMPENPSEEQRVLARVPVSTGDSNTFKNEVMEIGKYHEEETSLKKVSLLLRTSDVKRLEQLEQKFPMAIEFSLSPIDLLTRNQGEKQEFSILVVGAKQKDGHVFYQNVLHGQRSYMEPQLVQEELCRVLLALDGLPERIATDRDTARLIEPVAERCHIDVSIQESLPIATMVSRELSNAQGHVR